MTFRALGCAFEIEPGKYCTNHPQPRGSMVEGGVARWWEYCFEHLVERSVAMDRERKQAVPLCSCGQPAAAGCVECRGCIATAADAAHRAWREKEEARLKSEEGSGANNEEVQSGPSLGVDL